MQFRHDAQSQPIVRYTSIMASDGCTLLCDSEKYVNVCIACMLRMIGHDVWIIHACTGTLEAVCTIEYSNVPLEITARARHA